MLNLLHVLFPTSTLKDLHGHVPGTLTGMTYISSGTTTISDHFTAWWHQHQDELSAFPEADSNSERLSMSPAFSLQGKKGLHTMKISIKSSDMTCPCHICSCILCCILLFLFSKTQNIHTVNEQTRLLDNCFTLFWNIHIILVSFKRIVIIV